IGVLPVVASVLAVVLVLAGGVVLWRTLAAGGPRPAEILPASTFAVVTLDLDPSAGQKVEAIKTLRKLPSWTERTGVRPDSDLVKVLFERAQKDGFCPKLDYDEDVKPWIGQRAGVGGVLLDDKPAPVFALQVKDSGKAKDAVGDLVKCADAGKDVGWTLTDEFLVVSDSTSHAQAIVAAGRKAPLAEDAAYQKWTEEAGGDGIVNAYVARSAVKVLQRAVKSGMGGLVPGVGLGLPGQVPGGFPSDLPTDVPSELSQLTESSGAGASAPYRSAPRAADDPSDALDKAFEDFRGAAAVLRFADGGLELSMASGGAKKAGQASLGDHVAELPEDTAAVLAVAVPDSAFDALGSDAGRMLTGLIGEASGLEIPEDLETLFGDSLSISLGGDAPSDLASVSGPGDLPLGLLVDGDADAIEKVVAKVEARTGRTLADLPATLESADGKVALASTPAYAEKLLGDGSLGDDEDFKDAVPHADDAVAVAYASFDNDWTDALQDLAKDEDDPDAKEAAANLAALRAFGASAWTDGDTGHALVRLTLK
ncbi:MAG: DUF3352 domain-containing protein, partial [Marmoricola sp.]